MDEGQGATSNVAVSSMVTPREGMEAPSYWTLLCACQEVPLTQLPWDGGGQDGTVLTGEAVF